MNDAAREKQTMLAFLFQGIFFFIGYSFLDVTTVMPIFIEGITGRVELAGVASTIRQASTLSVQLFLGAYIMKVKNVPRYISLFMALGYAAPLMLVPALFFQVSATWLIALTFISVAVMWSADGLVVIGYYDLLGRTVSGENRSRVLGFSQLLGGGGAVVGTFIVKLILDHPRMGFQLKYMVIFSLGSLILLLGAWAMSRAKDLPHRQEIREYRLMDQLKKIPALFKGNPLFRQCMYCQICFVIALMSAPFVLIISKNQLGLSATFVSTLLNIQVVGMLIGGGISAIVGPKKGNGFVLLCFCLIGFLPGSMGLLAIFGLGNPEVLAVIMTMAAGLSAAAWIGFMNGIIDVTSGADRPVFMLMNSLITLPLAAVGLLGGQIIAHFGYVVFLGICCVFALLAILMGFRFYKNRKDFAYA